MNKVLLIGRVVKDFEVKATNNGKSVAMFSIAVDDGHGENKRTYFPSIVVWGKPAEACGKCLRKGSQVAISGKLTTRSYDAKDGSKRYVTEVVADMYDGVRFLDSKKQDNSSMDDEVIPF